MEYDNSGDTQREVGAFRASMFIREVTNWIMRDQNRRLEFCRDLVVGKLSARKLSVEELSGIADELNDELGRALEELGEDELLDAFEAMQRVIADVFVRHEAGGEQ